MPPISDYVSFSLALFERRLVAGNFLFAAASALFASTQCDCSLGAEKCVKGIFATAALTVAVAKDASNISGNRALFHFTGQVLENANETLDKFVRKMI